jgi:hypothetical protein
MGTLMTLIKSQCLQASSRFMLPLLSNADHPRLSSSANAAFNGSNVLQSSVGESYQVIGYD